MLPHPHIMRIMRGDRQIQHHIEMRQSELDAELSALKWAEGKTVQEIQDRIATIEQVDKSTVHNIAALMSELFALEWVLELHSTYK